MARVARLVLGERCISIVERLLKSLIPLLFGFLIRRQQFEDHENDAEQHKRQHDSRQAEEVEDWNAAATR